MALRNLAAILSPVISALGLALFWFDMARATEVNHAFAIAAAGILLGIAGIGHQSNKIRLLSATSGVVIGLLTYFLFIGIYIMFLIAD